MCCTLMELTENLVDKTRTQPVPLQNQQSYNNCAIKKLGATCSSVHGQELSRRLPCLIVALMTKLL